METGSSSDLYALILRWATLPALLLVLGICWVVTNILMSTKWQQARRSKQIRKAMERRARLAEAKAARESEKADDTSEPGP